MRHRRLILAQRAHAMKHTATFAEARLWERLRAGKLGARFRRQAVVGEFIADFLAPEARLIVEVDGGWHRDRGVADARRDRKLVRLGYRVLRLPEELVRERLEEAVARIRAAVAEPR